MADSSGKGSDAASMSPALLAFLQNASALILDQSTSSRPVLRRLLGELGVHTQSIKTAESYEEALDVLEFNKPQIVFADFELGERTALDLLRESGRFLNSRFESVFVVIAAENRPVVATAVGEGEVDALLVRPLIVQEVREKFLEAALLKADPGPYLKAIEAGRKLFEEGKDNEALDVFLRARRLDPKPSLACFFEGVVHRKGGRAEKALTSFNEGLSYQPTHYRCLLGVFELQLEQKHFDRAYASGMLLSEHYPIHPKRIPDMIRLCILNDRFVEVLRFAEAVSELDKADETLSKYVSAGLFICGKHLLRLGQQQEALEIFQKTEAVSRGRPAVLRELLVVLFVSGLRGPAEELLRRVPPEVSGSAEVRMAVLEAVHAEGPDAKGFLMSQELIREGVHTIRLYEIAILQARGLQRPSHVLEDLLLRALSAFPDQRAQFEKLARGPLELVA